MATLFFYPRYGGGGGLNRNFVDWDSAPVIKTEVLF